MTEKPNIFDRPIGRVPTVTLAGAADLLAAVFIGEDRNKLSEQFRTASKAGYIPRRFDGGLYTYGPEGVGTGALLIACYDTFKVKDVATAWEIVTACNAWSKINPRPPHIREGVPPIVAASVGVTRGEYWTFTISVFHHRKTNERRVVSAIYDVQGPTPDAAPWLPLEFLPRGTQTLGLWPLLEPLDAIYNGLRSAGRAKLDA
jgi:hypothetical protein